MNNIISRVSHKVRSPMTAIKGSIDLLKTEKFGTLNEEQLEIIKLADAGIAKLLLIIDDALSEHANP